MPSARSAASRVSAKTSTNNSSEDATPRAPSRVLTLKRAATHTNFIVRFRSKVSPRALYPPRLYSEGREFLSNPLAPAQSPQPPHPSPICHSDRSPAAFKKGVREAKKAKGAKKAKPFRL